MFCWRRQQEQPLIPKDGNCFFHCLARHLPYNHIEIRQRCANYLQKDQDFCQIWGISNEDIAHLRKVGNWHNNAMDVIPFVASNVFRVAMTIHNEDTRDKHTITPPFTNKTRGRIRHIRLRRGRDHYDLFQD